MRDIFRLPVHRRADIGPSTFNLPKTKAQHHDLALDVVDANIRNHIEDLHDPRRAGKVVAISMVGTMVATLIAQNAFFDDTGNDNASLPFGPTPTSPNIDLGPIYSRIATLEAGATQVAADGTRFAIVESTAQAIKTPTPAPTATKDNRVTEEAATREAADLALRSTIDAQDEYIATLFVNDTPESTETPTSTNTPTATLTKTATAVATTQTATAISVPTEKPTQAPTPTDTATSTTTPTATEHRETETSQSPEVTTAWPTTPQEAAETFGTDEQSQDPARWEKNEYGGWHYLQTGEKTVINPKGWIFEGFYIQVDGTSNCYSSDGIREFSNGGTIWHIRGKEEAKKLLSDLEAKGYSCRLILDSSESDAVKQELHGEQTADLPYHGEINAAQVTIFITG